MALLARAPYTTPQRLNTKDPAPTLEPDKALKHRRRVGEEEKLAAGWREKKPRKMGKRKK